MCIIAIIAVGWSVILMTVLLPIVLVALVTPLGNSKKLNNFITYPLDQLGKWIAQDELKNEKQNEM